MIRLLFILAFGLFQCAAQQLKFTELDPWYYSAGIYSVAYGAGKFVAVGDKVTFVSSDNGQTWTPGKNVPAMIFKGVVWGGTRFVAVGEGDKSIYSQDGLNWSVSTLSKSYGLTGIAWDPQTGVFITSGKLLVSADGASWAETPYICQSVAAGQGKFVALNSISVGFSNNGSAWIWSTPFPRWYDPNCTDAGFPSRCTVVLDTLGVTFAHGDFLAVAWYGNYFTSERHYPKFSSSDGQTWTKSTSLDTFSYLPFAINDAPFFASSVGCSSVAGAGDILVGNYNGISVGSLSAKDLHRALPYPTLARLSSLAVNGAVSVGVGAAGVIVVSTNYFQANAAVPAPAGSGGLNAVRFANGTYLAVGGGGTVIRSTDGLTWSKRVSNTSYELNDLAFGNGQWVAVGAAGRALTSADGSGFSLRFAGTELALKGLTFGAGQFVAVGLGGAIVTSANGVDWTAVGSEAVDLYGVGYGAGKFVAVGTNGVTMVSATGSIWTKGQIPGGYRVTRVAFANGYFVANELATSTVYVSKDGLVWQAQAVGATALYGVDAMDGEIWVSGDNTAIWRTSQGPAWAPGISAVRQGPSTIAFTVAAPVAGDYEIQFATSLPAASWQTATVLTGIEGTGSWVKNDAVDKGAFYRVVRR